MKKLTGLVIILIALILGSYYGMGYLTEKKVKTDLKVVNQSNGFSVKLEKYKRGWFTSEAIFDWRLHIPEHVVTNQTGQTQTVPAEDYQLNMPITIYHGPLIFADKTVKFGLGYAHTVLSLPAKISERFSNAFTSESTKPNLDLSVFVSYLNNTSIDMSLPEFKLISKANAGQFEWLGLSAATNVSSDRNKVSGNVTVEGFRFTKDQIKTAMSSITSEYNLHRAPGGGRLFLGDASLSIPSLDVTQGDQKLFDLSQFDVHSDTNIEEGLFSSHFKASLEKLVINNKIYGPGNLEVAIRNLDAGALLKINAQANQLQQGNEQQRQQAVLAMLPELPQLLSKGAEFEMTDLNFKMPEGTIEGNLLVSLPKVASANPFELIQKIQGSGKLKVPAIVLKNILTQTIQQRMAVSQQPSQNLQQGIVQQMQKQANSEASAPNANDNAAAPQQGSSSPAQATSAVATSGVVNPAEAAQQAAALADKQLAAMVQSGILLSQGNNYMIEISFNQGKLTVNGKPFEPAMLKFQ